MIDPKIIIAIDGFSSSGKSTLAKSLARALKYKYIDSGAMYRAVTLFALRNRWIPGGKPDVPAILEGLKNIYITFDFDLEQEMNITYLSGENVEEAIRSPEVSGNVSPVSAIPEVRKEMVILQRKIGENKGIVMDGRDIGTVVFPKAELKIFMTADPEIRAQRRFNELLQKGIKITMEEVRENLTRRDFMDQNREVSPLKKAEDAITLDNSYLTPQQQLSWALGKVSAITGSYED
jgi:cytidylate kinase